MESTMPKRKKIALVLIILVLCFIWGQSLLDGDTSTRESDFIYNLIYPFLYHVFGEVDATSHLLRKLAHFAEYAALGCSLSLYFGYDQRSILKGMNAALLAALFDESIQLLAVARGPQITDIWLDFSGAVTGILFFSVCFWAVVRIRERMRIKKQDPYAGN